MAAFGGVAGVTREAKDHRQGAYEWGAEEQSDDDEPHFVGGGGGGGGGKKVRWEAEDSEREIGEALNVVEESEPGITLPLKTRVHLLFDDPTSSKAALLLSSWFMLLIVGSTLAFMLETLPSLSADPEYGDPEKKQFWFILETFFVVFFTLEYVIRWITAENLLKFPFELFNVVDLLAIIPYYVELALSSNVNLRFIRVVRLARVFRVLKMGKKYDGAEILMRVLKDSVPALIPPFFFLFLGMVFFSSLMYICEQGTYDKVDKRFYVHDTRGHRVESLFVSIPDGMWWSLVTMLTVGYGDYTPHTALGKTVNSAAIVFGIMFSAMPIAIIGSAFTATFEEMRLKLKAADDFRANDQVNNTSNWGPNQLKFFGITFEDQGRTSISDFLDIGTSEKPLDATERPDKLVSRKLSHDLLTNRDRIENGVLPPSEWNLAYKIYHIMRSESSKCENNIESYTQDFISELYHVLGFSTWDAPTGIHLGFRSKAGLSVIFGDGGHKKEILSDSDLGVYALRPGNTQAVYLIANEASTTSSNENLGRIAGELLAIAQSCYKALGCRTDSDVRVFLVTFRGYHLRFYKADFSPSYLESISKGKKPAENTIISFFPPKRSMRFTNSTIMGTLDFLTPTHREVATEVLMRIKRHIIQLLSETQQKQKSPKHPERTVA
eukprot:TRINITY_DN34106_c0_g1_i1.p1 TRINITY_DN34106_c0_g1~~TRINITY_DN34106_c0_g1_i1.p1  ORF type:complete len:665 (+),score=82.01 TRINITY_DN34106_c0_g1_i1:60-2054(+)